MVDQLYQPVSFIILSFDSADDKVVYGLNTFGVVNCLRKVGGYRSIFEVVYCNCSL